MDSLLPIGFVAGAGAQQIAAAPVYATPVVRTVTEQDAEAPGPGRRAQDAKTNPARAEPEPDVVSGRHPGSLKFIVDGDRVVTTIVDDQRRKVVVQVPDEELIRIAKSIDRMQGFFIEQKA